MTKLYLKTAVLFFFVYLITLIILNGIEQNLAKQILLSVAGSIVSSLILTQLHISYIKNLVNDAILEKDLEVWQSTNFSINGNAGELFEQLKNQLLKQEWHLIEEDKETGKLHFRTKINFRSWAEKVTLKIDTLDQGLVNISATSVPILKTTMLDMGKNLTNIKLIERLGRSNQLASV